MVWSQLGGTCKRLLGTQMPVLSMEPWALAAAFSAHGFLTTWRTNQSLFCGKSRADERGLKAVSARLSQRTIGGLWSTAEPCLPGRSPGHPGHQGMTYSENLLSLCQSLIHLHLCPSMH